MFAWSGCVNYQSLAQIDSKLCFHNCNIMIMIFRTNNPARFTFIITTCLHNLILLSLPYSGYISSGKMFVLSRIRNFCSFYFRSEQTFLHMWH